MELLNTITAEKDRLTKKRAELETALATVDQELAAIAAYESVMRGTKSTTTSKRDAVLSIIRESQGITRKGIVDKLKSLGHDRPDAGVSNILNTLKKAGKVTAEGRTYAIPS